jgi:integrase
MAIKKEILDELLKDKDPKTMFSSEGLLGELKKALADRVLADTVDLATYQGQRDRALLLMGFAGAFRRSELVALDVAHLKLSEEGFVVTIAKSKTDQESEGQQIAIPRVPDSPPEMCNQRAKPRAQKPKKAARHLKS